MRSMTVLTIANRLSADQALGDMLERVARVQRVGGRRSAVQYTTDIVPMRYVYDALLDADET